MTENDRGLIVDPRMPAPARRLLNLVQRLLKCSPQSARRAIRLGRVSVNRRATRDPDRVLRLGDRVTVAAAPVAKTSAQRVEETWTLVYQDQDIVVVDKPAGLLTVPSPYGEKRTMISLLTRRLREVEAHAEVFSVHRLDRDVSGLLVFARSLDLARRLREQFALRKPERQYTAIVMGVPAEKAGTIRSYLATDKRLNRYSVASAEHGELAITHYRVVQPLIDTALLAVSLETGRRNQIRIHLAEMGHPIIGETRYRTEQAAHRAWPFKRLALHAARLSFAHPVSGAPLEFDAPLPWSFKHFFRQQARRSHRWDR